MPLYPQLEHANFESQSEIDKEIQKLQSWHASLPFHHVEGFEVPVDLFKYTNKYFKPPSKRNQVLPVCPTIIFDRQRYPPNAKGLKDLSKDLQSSAIESGTELLNRHNKYRFNCFRCRCHDRTSKKKKKLSKPDDNALSDLVAEIHPSNLDDESVEEHVNATLVESETQNANDFDENGVKIGIRERHYHRDQSYRRTKAQGLKRGTSTRLPLVSERQCKVCIVIDLHEDGFYYMRTGVGNNKHSFHPQTNPDHYKTKYRHVSHETKQLVENGTDASSGTAALRSMVFTNSNEYLSRSLLRRLQLEPKFLEASGSNTSTAPQLVNWLRKKASDPKVNLGYVVLNQRKSSSSLNYHRHSKGRPSVGAPRLDLGVVNERLTYVPFSNGTPNSDLEMFRNKSSLTNHVGIEETSLLSEDIEFDQEDNDNGKDTYDILHNDSERTRSILNEFRLDAERILLGAAWIDQDGWKMFQKYPEVLFIDTTHKSNNEGRPLLLIVGRDSNGKAFVVIRIFMPNETAGFYRWVFLRCVPYLLGKEVLSKVNVIITDGDSQEFTSIDQAIFKYFKSAIRLRCGVHVVMKTFEKSVMSSNFMPHKEKAEAQLQMIKNWVYSWMNGSSCYTKEQYELSKALLFQYLSHDADLKECCGQSGVDCIRKWLNQSVIPLEENYVFYKKTYIECMDEYVNNAVEGMNYTQKKAEISAKPNMNMATSATKMMKNNEMCTRDRMSELTYQVNSVPLYVDPKGGHNVDCLSKLVTMGRHFIILQFRGEIDLLSMFIVPYSSNYYVCRA